ncbi:MAG: hypothetical protein ABW110_04750 [Steroidobacteraceae bacterium]
MRHGDDWISTRAWINPATKLIEFPRTLRLRSGQLIENPLDHVLDSLNPRPNIELPANVRRKVDLHAYFNVKTRQFKYRQYLSFKNDDCIANPLREFFRRPGSSQDEDLESW